MPGAGCYQSGADIPPWRLTNRKEATVSQSVRMRQAAFESTNEDPAESEAEGGKTPKEAEADRKRERGEGEENTKPDADRGRTGGRTTTGYNATPGWGSFLSIVILLNKSGHKSIFYTRLLNHVMICVSPSILI